MFPRVFVHIPKGGKGAIIFSDLDGTLLEHDGTILPEVAHLVRELAQKEVRVVPVSSKTRREIRDWLTRLTIPGPGIFENGAGVLLGDSVEISPLARPAGELAGVLEKVCRESSIEVRPLASISEQELESLTGLSPREQQDARSRDFSVPFLADPSQMPLLWDRLSKVSELSLVRGGRFWHLMGRHQKSDFFTRVKNHCGAWGTSIGLGDAPNDIPILKSVDWPAVIPGARGLSHELTQAFPEAFAAKEKAGRGWVESITRLLPASFLKPDSLLHAELQSEDEASSR